MNFSRLSLILVAFGAVSFVLWEEDVAIPLKLALVYFGGLGVFGGGLFAVIGALQRRRTPNARSNLLVDAGWTTVSFGLIASIGSYLVLTQTRCFSPFLRAGNCNLAGYYAPMYAGLALAAAGLGVVVFGRLFKTVASLRKLRQ